VTFRGLDISSELRASIKNNKRRKSRKYWTYLANWADGNDLQSEIDEIIFSSLKLKCFGSLTNTNAWPQWTCCV